MTQIYTGTGHSSAISASWARCQQQHNLVREATRPILRLQSSEVTPRLESLLDRTSGSQGIFQQLAESVTSSGNCLVVTDENGVLVRLDSKNTKPGVGEWNGIALGSCWDERIAGTNGVSMALLEGRSFTVRGKDHFFSKLAQFSCTAVPLLDSENQTIGVLNLSAIDRNNVTDYLYARQLLESASDRIQRNLFERMYRQSRIISVSMPDQRYLFRSNELIAVNDDGIILSATAKAHNLVGMSQPADLKGKSFELLFGTEPDTLRIPERVVSIGAHDGLTLNLQRYVQSNTLFRRRKHDNDNRDLRHPDDQKSGRHNLTPTLKDLVIGSETMANLCNRATAYFHRALPFLIEGASGTGKSALVTGLLEGVMLSANQVVTIDCATLGEDVDDRRYFRTLIEQARAIDSLTVYEKRLSTIVFDNIDELPMHAQAELRKLLCDIELQVSAPKRPLVSDLRIIATCRNPLDRMVEQNRFRDDLYYLLAGAVIRLPEIAQREQPEKLIQFVAAKLTGAEVEITAEAQLALVSYDWPGNVRQLRSVLKQALIEGDGNRISRLDLNDTPILKVQSSSAQLETYQPQGSKTSVTYDERTMLLDALQGTHWNASQAARNLGIGRATIHRKMNLHGIKRPT